MASSLPDVIPDQIGNIQFFKIPRQIGPFRGFVPFVTYVITTTAEYNYEDRVNQLLRAYESGDMDRALHEYAERFGVPGLQQAHLSRPEILNGLGLKSNGLETASEPSDRGARLDAVEVSAIVIGGFFFVLIICASVWSVRRWQKQ